MFEQLLFGLFEKKNDGNIYIYIDIEKMIEITFEKIKTKIKFIVNL